MREWLEAISRGQPTPPNEFVVKMHNPGYDPGSKEVAVRITANETQVKDVSLYLTVSEAQVLIGRAEQHLFCKSLIVVA